ncbi:trm112p-like protein isoform X2 [Tasmannia lanceolata]|uniref:trm112p-like protein isoform X2 n=1 Tax=Tasmannia lanceolata TaxID=3420 RepID=UPI004063ED4F
MVRGSRALLKAFSELLVCPLSKQPLRLSQDSNSLISDTLGVSYPLMEYLVWCQRMENWWIPMIHLHLIILQTHLLANNCSEGVEMNLFSSEHFEMVS